MSSHLLYYKCDYGSIASQRHEGQVAVSNAPVCTGSGQLITKQNHRGLQSSYFRM